jgi:hypothetical protein
MATADRLRIRDCRRTRLVGIGRASGARYRYQRYMQGIEGLFSPDTGSCVGLHARID